MIDQDMLMQKTREIYDSQKGVILLPFGSQIDSPKTVSDVYTYIYFFNESKSKSK